MSRQLKTLFNNKGYFFIIDALLGSTIILLSLMIILSSNIKTHTLSYDYGIAEDYSTFILNTKTGDLDNDYVRNLTEQGIIRNPGYTIMEQVDEFYAYNNAGNLTLATNMIQNITDPLIPSKYGFSYIMRSGSSSTKIYSRNESTLSYASAIIVSRKVTFLRIDENNFFGPAIAEIRIWI